MPIVRSRYSEHFEPPMSSSQINNNVRNEFINLLKIRAEYVKIRAEYVVFLKKYKCRVLHLSNSAWKLCFSYISHNSKPLFFYDISHKN